jgi:parvulin-like peptidyl-prolyl isomerase
MGTMLALKKQIKRLHFLLLILLLLSACSGISSEVTETQTPVEATLTPTMAKPTATLMPAAAIINGERLPLSWFENEFAQYLKAQEASEQPVENMSAAREFVLQDLIDQFLLAQAAQNAGMIITDEQVQEKIDSLRDQVDLDSWMAEWGYSGESLFQSLKWQMLAAKQRELILENVPEAVTQVELQQIFAYTETGARNALASLNAGKSFEEVALVYDPVTGGYLGWVPKGYLLISAVEDAAFNLSIGEHSDIIESDIGYHIIKMLDRQERPLSRDAQMSLQRQALQSWIGEQRSASTIEVLIDE